MKRQLGDTAWVRLSPLGLFNYRLNLSGKSSHNARKDGIRIGSDILRDIQLREHIWLAIRMIGEGEGVPTKEQYPMSLRTLRCLAA